MAKVAPTGLAVVLGHRQMQNHQLVALAGVFEGALAGRLDPQSLCPAVDAGGSVVGLGPHMDLFLTIYSQDRQIRQAQYRMNLGHGITSIELVFALTSLINTVVPL